MTNASDTPDDPLAPAARTLAALCNAGAADVDLQALVRLEATVRRGQRQDPAVQCWLAARLAGALAALQAQVEGAVSPRHGGPTPDAEARAHVRLVPDRVAQLRALHQGQGGELRTAQQLRPTLARLRVQRQLARAQARQPENPGPLNSEHLLVRALQQMQTLAPAYLASFITQMETLLWLDTARGAGGPEQGTNTSKPAQTPVHKSARKPARKTEQKPRVC